MPGDLQSPYPIDMLAIAWLLGIANPQSIKRLGHFLTADCKSAGTPNGGRAYPALLALLVVPVSHHCTYTVCVCSTKSAHL